MKKIVAFALCLCLMVGMLPIAAFAIEDEKGNAGGVTLDKEDAFPAIHEALGEYLVNEVHFDEDRVLGIPVDLHIYAKVGKGAETAPVVQYVINTNTERLGTESDVSILTDMIEEYIIVVVDYHNNSLATAMNVDRSTHQIQLSTVTGTYLTYKDESGTTQKLNIITQCDNWILPAGYRLMRDVPYFNYKEHGVEGTLDRIAQIWNEDFSVSNYKDVVISWGQKTTEDGRLVFNDQNGVRCYENSEKNGYVYDNGSLVSGEVTPEYKKLREGRSYVDATARTAKITDTWAEDWWDCAKRDGTPVDLNLYLDIMYPSEPEDGADVPVLAMASSRQSTTGNWYASNENPEYLGTALFDGYAVLLYEYAYLPMARRDHYGYFSDSPLFEGTTGGSDWKYGLSKWIGLRASRAAIRTFRYECVTNPALSAINENAIGLVCISKTGYNIFLGNANPEEFAETQLFFEGQDESQVQPHLTYPDGTPIPCNVQAVYGVSGSSSENMTEGFCPIYVSVGKQDAGAYAGYYKTVRLNAKRLDLESVHYALPLLGHAYLEGMDEEYNVDTYQSVIDFFNYHVAGRQGAIEYITPLSGTTNVGTTDTITVKFNASVSLSTVLDKVKIVNAKTGEEATGSWSSLYGNTEWRFTPDGLDGGATYLVYVPEDTETEDGRTMKESKTAAFITVPEKNAVAGTVSSESGVKTVTDQNKVFFIFERPSTASSASEMLRFTVTNEQAAQMLSVYALSEIDSENPAASALGEKIGTIAIAGAGFYEIDITEYLKGVPNASTVGFALVGERTVGTTVLHSETYDTADSPNTLIGSSAKKIKIEWSDLYDRNGTGGSIEVTKAGGSYYFNNALGFGNSVTAGAITESDLGRLFRIRMSVLVSEKSDVKQFFKAFVHYNNPEKTGVNQYVDWEDTTFTIVHPGLVPGEWVDIDFYYQVSDPTYTAENIQKCMFALTSSDGVFYIDNYTVEEIVSGVDISTSISPSIVTHPSMKVDTTLLDAIMAKSGGAGDVYFGSTDGLLVSGQSLNISTFKGEKVYLKLALESFDPTVPALLTLNVAQTRFGKISLYGITDKALGESWTAETISWQNAPANDRFGYGVDPELTTYLQTIEVNGIGTHKLDLSDFCQQMVDQGAKSATVIAVLEGVPGDLLYSTDFEGGLSGDIKPGSSGGTPFDVISEALAYPDGGTFAYEVLANSSHSRAFFNIGSALTEADLGKKFTIKYHFYSEDGGTYAVCMRPSSKELQSQKVTVEAGVWSEQTYSFTVTEEMLGKAPKFTFVASKLGDLTSSEGEATSRFYVDNIRMYESTGNIAFTITEQAVAGRTPIIEADFDNTTLTVGSSGGAKGYIGVGPDDIAYSGTKTMYWTATGSTQRPMLYLFDTITEEMVGQQYEITYMFYSTGSGYFNTYPRMVPKIDGTSKAYEFRSAASPLKITYAEAGKWQKVTTVFTVTQEMYDLTSYDNGSLRIAFEPQGLDASEANPVTCYVDDLRVYSLAEEEEEEEIILPYIYQNGFEDTANSVESGFEKTTFGSTTAVVNTDDRKTGGEGSLKILANRSYNRLLMYNIIDGIGYINKKDGVAIDSSWLEGATEGCLTEEDIGRKFRVSFYIKSEVAGTIKLAVSNRKGGYISTEQKSYEIPGDYQWTKVVYEFTVNETMITNRQASIVIFFSDFSYSEDGTTLRTLYIDDFTSTEIIEGYGASLSLSESAVISNRTDTSKTDELWVDNASSYDTSYEDIHATLVTFAPDAYLSTNDAILKIKLKQYNGQTIHVYGLLTDPGEGATYNDITALKADGSINSIAVFGGAPIATFTADREQINLSITEYVKARDKQPLVLLFVSEDSSKITYLSLDFENTLGALGKDITSDGTLSYTDGKLSTTGSSMSFTNLIDFSGTPLTSAQAYAVKLTVSAQSERDFTLTLNGSNVNVTKALQNGEFVAEFVADKADLTTLTLTASVAGFTIDSFEFATVGENVEIDEVDMDIMLADKHEDLSVISGALANMTLAEDATLSLYFPNALINTLSSMYLDGKQISIAALDVKDDYRVLKITGIAAKDLAKYHTLTFNFNSGVTRTVDVSAMEYLARLITSDEADLELRRLVHALVDYAREAQGYFLGKSALGYEIMYTALLDEYARYGAEAAELATAPEIGAAGAVITDAAIHLADAPEYLFRISESFTGTITLTQGAYTECYTVENGLVDGESIIVFRPSGVYAAADTVTITTEGTTNAVGAYGLANYRAAALSASLSKVVGVVDSLARYIEAARVYKSTLAE